jgi:hypothetical protein
MYSEVNSFLGKLEGKVVIVNYNGRNIEETKVFNAFEGTHDSSAECFYLSNVDDEIFSFMVFEREIQSIHTDIESMQIQFNNGDNLEICFESDNY